MDKSSGKPKRNGSKKYTGNQELDFVEAEVKRNEENETDCVITDFGFVERAFRITKSNLEAWPIFHFTEKRIETHICICFIAYKVYKELERIIKLAKIDISVDSVLKIAKTIATIRIKMPNNGKVRQQTLLLTSAQHSIKSLFDIETILKKDLKK